jgi:hypothetical protein
MQLKIAASRPRQIEHVHFVEMTQAQHRRSINAAYKARLRMGLHLLYAGSKKTQRRRSTDAACKCSLIYAAKPRKLNPRRMPEVARRLLKLGCSCIRTLNYILTFFKQR